MFKPSSGKEMARLGLLKNSDTKGAPVVAFGRDKMEHHQGRTMAKILPMEGDFHRNQTGCQEHDTSCAVPFKNKAV